MAPAVFATTHWSVVVAAGAQSSDALEKLCRAYWYPLFAFVRRQGNDLHAAQDLTQEFFARLLDEGHYLAEANPTRGRFRSFLLASLKNFLANEWHRSQRQKQGGGCVFFSTGEAVAEEERHFELADHGSPDKVYERRWAEAVLARVNSRLRHEYEAAGWGERFEILKVYLLHDYDPVSYAETAARLALTESAVKSAIAITKAEWVKHNKILAVEATSSAAPSVTLSVNGFGSMTYNTSLGRYVLTRSSVNNPISVTVQSDIGGTVTATVRKR